MVSIVFSGVNPAIAEEPIIGMPVPVINLYLDPGSASIMEGQQQNFRAYAVFADGMTQDVTYQVSWSSSNYNIAANYDDNTFYGVNAGSTSVNAQYVQPGAVLAPMRASAAITVKSNAGPGPAPGKPKLTIRPNTYIVNTGQGIQYKAYLISTGTQYPSEIDVSNQCSWGVTNSVAYQQGTGYFVGQYAGVGTVYASYGDTNGQYYDETELRVREKERYAELHISPSTASIYSGESKSYTATLVYSDGSKADVTRDANWEVRNTRIAYLGSTKGLVSGDLAGNTTVVATYNYQGKTLKDTADLNVYERYTEKITITPSKSNINIGDTVKFNAILSSTSGSADKDVTNTANWTISHDIAKSTSNGTYRGTNEGNASIQASYISSSGNRIYASASLDVKKKTDPRPPEPVTPKEADFTIGSTIYTLDGIRNTMDVAPYIKEGRTLVPQRYLAYALGLSDNDIVWNAAGQTVSFTKGNTVVVITVGSVIYTVNGVKHTMDGAPPEITKGRLMCPARFVAEAFGYEVGWDPNSEEVLIKKK